MDALDLLEEQHRAIGGVFDRLATEPGIGHRTAIVADLVRMIDAHTRSEERHLYAAYADITADPTRLYAGHEIHALVRHAAETLLRTRATDVRFRARVALLRDLFDRHANEEEDWLFQAAKREMTDERLDEVGTHCERAYGVLLEARRVPATAARRTKTARGPRSRGLTSRPRPARRTNGSALRT